MMSTARYFLWLFTALMLLVSPLVFVSSLSPFDYWKEQSALLIGFGLWLTVDEGGSYFFAQRAVSDRTPINYIIMALITSSLLLLANKWHSAPIPSDILAFTLLVLLPTVVGNSFFERPPLRLISLLLRGAVIGLLAFRLSLTEMHWHHWLFAGLFSVSLSAVSAVNSLLPHVLPKTWGNPVIATALGLTPTVCMIAVGARILPPVYLLTLIGLIPMIRLSVLLSSHAPEAAALEAKRSRATNLVYVTIFTQNLLLIFSALLSSQIWRDTL